MKCSILIPLFLVYNNFLLACSCNGIPPFEDRADAATEIFLGKLINIRDCNEHWTFSNKRNKSCWAASFKVQKKWKGNNNKFISIYQPHSSCDFYFDSLNQNYIVYAYEDRLFFSDTLDNDIEYTTNMCERNANEYIMNEVRDDKLLLDEKFPDKIYLIDFRLIYTTLFFLLFLIIYLKRKIIISKIDTYSKHLLGIK